MYESFTTNPIMCQTRNSVIACFQASRKITHETNSTLQQRKLFEVLIEKVKWIRFDFGTISDEDYGDTFWWSFVIWLSSACKLKMDYGEKLDFWILRILFFSSTDVKNLQMLLLYTKKSFLIVENNCRKLWSMKKAFNHA